MPSRFKGVLAVECASMKHAKTELLQRDADLTHLNSLRLPARASHYVAVGKVGDLARLWALQAGLPARRLVLGGGSNLLLAGDVDGLVLAMRLMGKRIEAEDDDAVLVRAAAGESWHDLVQWTLSQGLGGLENLALIPGTVGAAPIQNIGAYGLEVGERLHQVEAFDFKTGRWRFFDADECRFGYRDSVFKQQGWHLDGRMIITAVTFRLPRRWRPCLGYSALAEEVGALSMPGPGAVAEAVMRIRRRKLPDPAQLPNAGSFFHNPVVSSCEAENLRMRHPDVPCYPQPDGRVKLAAGWLIEQAGWKGRSLGPVGMYEKQALVLVNQGGGDGTDVLCLAKRVMQDVLTRFGLTLQIEPVIWGEAGGTQAFLS